MDNRMLPHAFFAITTLLCVGTKSFAEPTNIATLRNEIKQYHDSGAYDKEIATVAKQAQAYIDKRVQENKKRTQPEKLAIVLDIDETSLSNYSDILSRDFCEDKKAITRGILKANAPAIAPVLSLYQNARKEGVAIFFVTGRGPALQQATEKNLKAEGYKAWTGIFFRPTTDKNTSISPYKTQVRRTISQEGYTIIASLGDQKSDFNGNYAEKTFKLPNPFYYLN